MKMLVNSEIYSNNEINNIPFKRCDIAFQDCIKNKQLSGVYHTYLTPHREHIDTRQPVDATNIRKIRNAGGSSKESEALSVELFERCFNAKLIKTEMQIKYEKKNEKKTDENGKKTDDNGKKTDENGKKTDDNGKKTDENGKKTDDNEKKTYYNGKMTDYVCKIDDTIIGVSVTRARSYLIDRAKKMAEKYPDRNILPGRPFSLEDAFKLLKKKLECINESNQYSLENWNKQVLHVWSAEKDISDKLEQAFHHLQLLKPELVSNTVLLITTTTSTACDFIYMKTAKSPCKMNNAMSATINSGCPKSMSLTLPPVVLASITLMLIFIFLMFTTH